MEKLFETALFTRSSMTKILESKSYEDLVKIPDNFRNSIFWNIAHVLVTQQLLCYKLSGIDLSIDEAMVEKYRKGSTAVEEVLKEDIDYVKEHLISASQKLGEDYKKGVFKDFKPYMTSTGVGLNTIEDAISFSTYHDGIHLGIVLSIMKIV